MKHQPTLPWLLKAHEMVIFNGFTLGLVRDSSSCTFFPNPIQIFPELPYSKNYSLLLIRTSAISKASPYLIHTKVWVAERFKSDKWHLKRNSHFTLKISLINVKGECDPLLYQQHWEPPKSPDPLHSRNRSQQLGALLVKSCWPLGGSLYRSKC